MIQTKEDHQAHYTESVIPVGTTTLMWPAELPKLMKKEHPRLVAPSDLDVHEAPLCLTAGSVFAFTACVLVYLSGQDNE